MLTKLLAEYTTLQQALGFKFRTASILLRSFVTYAEERGDHYVMEGRVRDWALLAPSPEQHGNRFLTVRRFAISLHAEDPRHEIPSGDLFGRAAYRRRIPKIYRHSDIQRLIDGALALGPAGSIRPRTYRTMFGLIAATGMRVSEPLAIRVGDVTYDGLIITQTKVKKSRLLPLHPTTRRALDHYLTERITVATQNETLFISPLRKSIAYPTVVAVLLQIVRAIGLRGAPGSGGPRIHDLRHTFAVRSLEQCAHDGQAVARHISVLSTYLGHSHVSDTYWYLHATPDLMLHVAAARESLYQGELT